MIITPANRLVQALLNRAVAAHTPTAGALDLPEAYSPPMSLAEVAAKHPHLLNDETHKWRAQHGIELIHNEPTREELERIAANWERMTPEQKKLSDEQSQRLFGITNAEHLAKLRLPRHIYLTGHPGAGKTTEGERLSKETGMPLVSLDGVRDWFGRRADSRRSIEFINKHLDTPHIVEGMQILGFRPVDLEGHDVRVIDAPKETIVQRLMQRGWEDNDGNFMQGPGSEAAARALHADNEGRVAKLKAFSAANAKREDSPDLLNKTASIFSDMRLSAMLKARREVQQITPDMVEMVGGGKPPTSTFFVSKADSPTGQSLLSMLPGTRNSVKAHELTHLYQSDLPVLQQTPGELFARGMKGLGMRAPLELGAVLRERKGQPLADTLKQFNYNSRFWEKQYNDKSFAPFSWMGERLGLIPDRYKSSSLVSPLPNSYTTTMTPTYLQKAAEFDLRPDDPAQGAMIGGGIGAVAAGGSSLIGGLHKKPVKEALRDAIEAALLGGGGGALLGAGVSKAMNMHDTGKLEGLGREQVNKLPEELRHRAEHGMHDMASLAAKNHRIPVEASWEHMIGRIDDKDLEAARAVSNQHAAAGFMSDVLAPPTFYDKQASADTPIDPDAAAAAGMIPGLGPAIQGGMHGGLAQAVNQTTRSGFEGLAGGLSGGALGSLIGSGKYAYNHMKPSQADFKTIGEFSEGALKHMHGIKDAGGKWGLGGGLLGVLLGLGHGSQASAENFNAHLPQTVPHSNSAEPTAGMHGTYEHPTPGTRNPLDLWGNNPGLGLAAMGMF